MGWNQSRSGPRLPIELFQKYLHFALSLFITLARGGLQGLLPSRAGGGDIATLLVSAAEQFPSRRVIGVLFHTALQVLSCFSGLLVIEQGFTQTEPQHGAVLASRQHFTQRIDIHD